VIVSITGHTNIEKALGLDLVQEHGATYNKEAFYKVYSEILEGLIAFCKEKQIQLSDLTLVSGMARGVDEVFAFVAIRNGLKLILSIPGSISWHRNRTLSRNMRAQAIYYDEILAYNNLVNTVEVTKSYNGGNFNLVNLARNQHMVDISDGVFCYKSYESTGTNDCILRAKKQNKFIKNLSNSNLDRIEFE